MADNYSELDDAALLGLMARGQDGALAALYDRYGRLVYSVAYHAVGDAETAEEITQDVFVRAWESAHTYRAEMARVGTWLVSITRNRSIDELRRRGARPEKARVDWPEDVGQESMDGLPPLDGPEGLVDTHLQQRGIRQAIAGLPAEQRTVLNLAYFHGMSHSEMAQALGEPLGTVKSRVRLALQKLRDALFEKGIVE